MSNVSAYSEKLALDFLMNAQAATRPTAWGVGLSYGVPSSTSGSEITADAGYARKTIGFGAAASPGGSLTNTVAATFGPFSQAGSITGIHVWDSVLSSNSGNLLWYGNLTTPRTVGVGDSLVVASGALTISLA